MHVTELHEPKLKWENSKTTFIHNMNLPVHRWYRFPAGFSADWVKNIVEQSYSRLRKNSAFLDPFAGVGTAVLAAESAGIRAYGIEAQPFIARISQTKLLWHTDRQQFLKKAENILTAAQSRSNVIPSYPSLIQKCYTEDAIRDLHNLRSAWEEIHDDTPSSQLTWLAIISILRVCSFAGTAPWQYVLPRKTKTRTFPPYEAFRLQVQRMLTDMITCQTFQTRHDAEVFWDDSRVSSQIQNNSVGLVVTSPPYANNYDYADATRLEMTFFGDVTGWGDLHEKARRWLIRSCSQHVSIEQASLPPLLQNLSDVPFLMGITQVCETLERERLAHGGKKDYHLMVAAYFSDMKEVWKTLRRVCIDGSEVYFVVGDSAPYGIHVPVDRWLGELAVLSGFKSYRFEKLRDRNVKWRNRKHCVPLHEGLLYVQG
jgi:hypothetical protein